MLDSDSANMTRSYSIQLDLPSPDKKLAGVMHLQKDGSSALIDLLAKAHDGRCIANENGFPIAGCRGKRHVAARLHFLRSHHRPHCSSWKKDVVRMDRGRRE